MGTSPASRYAKAIVAVIGLIAQAVAAYTADGQAQNIAQIVIAVLTALGVYQVPNTGISAGDPRNRGL